MFVAKVVGSRSSLVCTVSSCTFPRTEVTNQTSSREGVVVSYFVVLSDVQVLNSNKSLGCGSGSSYIEVCTPCTLGLSLVGYILVIACSSSGEGLSCSLQSLNLLQIVSLRRTVRSVCNSVIHGSQLRTSNVSISSISLGSVGSSNSVSPLLIIH